MKTNDQNREPIPQWDEHERWSGIERPYTAEEVRRLSGSIKIEHTLADRGARRLWELFHTDRFTSALGALTGGQAVEQVQAGLKAVYVSGWQVAADNNTIGHTYPDQSLYPADSVPNLVRRINNALLRADQIGHMNGGEGPGVLVCPYRRRCGGGFWGDSEHFRADEGDDRGRGGRGRISRINSHRPKSAGTWAGK